MKNHEIDALVNDIVAIRLQSINGEQFRNHVLKTVKNYSEKYNNEITILKAENEILKEEIENLEGFKPCTTTKLNL